ncbi:hypothetical protein BC629DRAFT_1586451 [Irpex lacteus]|nr:hypothetical protein BC629DRAFT_1586451 [Irpex lacteus]
MAALSSSDNKKNPHNAPIPNLTLSEPTLAIPPQFSYLLPAVDLPIAKLLEFKLPIQSSSLAVPHIDGAFSSQLPTESLDASARRPIPPPAYVQAIRQAVVQAVLEKNARSIIDKGLKQVRSPLQILTFWEKAAIAWRAQLVWKDAESWVSYMRNKYTQDVDEVLALLRELSWATPLHIFQAIGTVDLLATLLSDKPLNDEIINMLVAHLGTSRVRHHPDHARSTVLAPTYLIDWVRSCYGQSNRKGKGLACTPTGSLLDLQRPFSKKQRKFLFCVANIRNQHWILVRIDFVAQTIAYGDSNADRDDAPNNAIKAVLKNLSIWLVNEFGTEFKVLGNILPCGRQQDAVSCGVCAVNALAHNLFGDTDPLFVHANRRLIRVEYFILLAREQIAYQTEHTSQPRIDTADKADDSDLEIIDDPTTVEETPTSDHDSMPAFSPPTSPSLPPTRPLTPVLSELDEPVPMDVEDADGAGLAITVDSEQASVPVSATQNAFDFLLGNTAEGVKHDTSLQSLEGSSQVGLRPGTTKRTSKPTAVRRLTAPPTGTSRSARHSQKVKEAVKSGTYQPPSQTRIDSFEEKLRKLDPNAEPRYRDDWSQVDVWCPKCQELWPLPPGELFKFTVFEKHYKQCSGKSKGTRGRSTAQPTTASKGAHTLDFFAAQQGWIRRKVTQPSSDTKPTTAVTPSPIRPRSHSPEIQYRSVPCTGVTAIVDSHITQYVSRATDGSGGARAKAKIAEEIFGITYSALDSDEKRREVDRLHKHEKTWHLDRTLSAVFSSQCLKKVRVLAELDLSSSSALDEQQRSRLQLCAECTKLSKDSYFKTAIRRPIPEPENRKFANKQHLGEAVVEIFAKYRGLEDILVGEKSKRNSEFAQLAVALMNGKLESGTDVLKDIFTALLELRKREERGVGKQNFTYGPALLEFANIALLVSPQLYRMIKQTLGVVPHERSIKRVQSSVPRFPIGLVERVFVRAGQYLQELRYKGPLALSCDDTKLHAALRTCWDSETKKHVLLGGVGEPRIVASPEELEQALQDLDGQKASKLRLWCLHIVGVPKLPPIILAAKAIPDDLKVPELTEMSDYVIQGCLRHNLLVVSYACDGTDTERGVQTRLVELAPQHRTYSLPHPVTGCDDIIIRIALIHGKPIAMIQDSNHGRKTLRNNLMSGARVLDLGNDVATYEDARKLAFDTVQGPCYHRDFEKVDRQDDNAAIRTFSASAVEFLAQHHPECVGLIVYLFVFGELIDAYQNRLIHHEERITMVLRAYYFLETWRAYLAMVGYPEARYCISRQAIDIVERLVLGLLSLVFIYRDFPDDDSTPLLPWLHSTETCEHVFGECRKLVKDFTYLDFLYSVPKLHVLLRGIISLGLSGDAKARASGYSHIYFSGEVDIAALSQMPSNERINTLNSIAFDEQDSLWEILGVSARHVLGGISSSTHPLPSISSWWQDGEDPAHTSEASESEDPFDFSLGIQDTADDASGESLTAEDEVSEDELRNTIDSGLTAFGRKVKDDNRVEQLACAAVMLTLSDTARMQEIQDSVSNEQLERYNAEDREVVDQFRFAALHLPQLNIAPELIRPFDRPLHIPDSTDFSSLIALRLAHQTKYAAKSVRTKSKTLAGAEDFTVPGSELVETPTGPKSKTPSARQELKTKLDEISRRYALSDRGPTSGLTRQAHWNTTPLTGNSANAALASGQRAVAVIQRRARIYEKYRLPRLDTLSTGLVGNATNQPGHDELQRGSLCLVVVKNELFIGKVITQYVGSGGKSVTHGWTKSVANIGLASYIVVQLFQYSYENRFRSDIDKHAQLRTPAFAHVSVDCILRRLAGTAEISRDKKTLIADSAILRTFLEYSTPSVQSRVVEAVKELVKGRRQAAKRAGNTDSEE